MLYAPSIAISLFIGGALPALDTSIGVEYACAGVTLFLTIIIAVWLDWRRTRDAMSVLALTGFFYLLAFDIGSIFIWFNPQVAGAPIHRYPFTHQAMVHAEWLCVLTWIGFAIGYRVRGLKFLRIRPLALRAAPESAGRHVLILLYVVGWVARFVGTQRGLYFHVAPQNSVEVTSSTVNQIIYVLGLVPLISVAYLGIQSHTKVRLRRWYFLALLVELGFALPSGTRSDAISVLVLALAVSYYTSRRFPLKTAALAAIIGLFFVFPVLYLYRTSHAKASNTSFGVNDFSTGVGTYTSAGVTGAMLFGVESTLSRFSDLATPARLEEVGTHAYPVMPGETIAWFFINYVPHAIDPSKPAVGQFSNNIGYALHLTASRDSSIAPTQVGEMYLNFGTVGAVIAMVILGSIYREINEWFRLRRTRPAVLAMFAAFAYAIIHSQESIVAVGLGGLIRDAVVIGVVINGLSWLIGRPMIRRSTLTTK